MSELAFRWHELKIRAILWIESEDFDTWLDILAAILIVGHGLWFSTAAGGDPGPKEALYMKLLPLACAAVIVMVIRDWVKERRGR